MGGAYALGRFTSNLLYDIQPGDPATYAGLVVLLTATTVLASWIPARHAQRVDPRPCCGPSKRGSGMRDPHSGYRIPGTASRIPPKV